MRNLHSESTDELSGIHLHLRSTEQIKMVVAQRLEKLLSLLVAKLELPAQCLTCAFVILERAMRPLFQRRLFLSSFTVEK